MNHNLFQFGDTFWLQIAGTAMGAPPAPTYANALFGTHENKIVPQHKPLLLFDKRFVDDIFGIWNKLINNKDDTTMWQKYKDDLNSWGLVWDVSERTNSV